MLKVCENPDCGKQFEPAKHVGDRQKACSRSCRRHASYLRTRAPAWFRTLVCKWCGDKFTTTALGGREGRKWCSSKCSQAARRGDWMWHDATFKREMGYSRGSSVGMGNGNKRRWEFDETLLILADPRNAVELYESGLLLDRSAKAIASRRQLLRQRAVAVGGIDRMLDLMYSSTETPKS